MLGLCPLPLCWPPVLSSGPLSGCVVIREGRDRLDIWYAWLMGRTSQARTESRTLDISSYFSSFLGKPRISDPILHHVSHNRSRGLLRFSSITCWPADEEGWAAHWGSSDLTKRYSLVEAGGCIGTRRAPSQSPRPCITLNLLCCTKLLYVTQNTHSRAGSVSLNGLILNPKLSINTYHTNPQQLTWFAVQACKGLLCH